MSTQPAMPLPSVAYGSARALSAGKIAGVSITGVMLFITSLLVLASGFPSLRPEVMGLLLHPYLVPVAICFPFVVMSRIGEFPARILAALLVFTAMYSYSAFNGGSLAVGEVFKTASSVITIVTVALLVRRRGDMVAGAVGLSIAVAVLAVNGLKDPTGASGVHAIEGANKNSYSVFALPAILMAGYIALRMKTAPTAVKTLLIACTLPALAAIFMSGNRSGYLGAALVGLMLFWDRRGKGLLLVGAVAAAVAFWMINFGSTQVFDQKMQETAKGYAGDDVRKDILRCCLEIGMENPIIGVSPQVLPFEIGRRISLVHEYPALDAHNVFAHLFGGSGIICLAALLVLGWTMYAWRPRDGIKVGGDDDPLRDARRLMRMMVILWAVRGAFTADILYSPSFCIGLGLSIGLCMLAEIERKAIGYGARGSLAAGNQANGMLAAGPQTRGLLAPGAQAALPAR
jgi:hypothetical protein